MLKFQGKTALITGSGTGIGQAIAKKFVENGASVIILGRRREPLDETSKMLEGIISEKNSGANVKIFSGVDVADESAMTGMFDAIKNENITVDYVINNAGVSGPVTCFANAPLDDFKSTVGIHLTGAIGSFDCSGTTTAKFNENTLWVNITSVVVDTPIDIDCVFEGFHGDVEKDLDAPCEVQIMDQDTAECSFTITYIGVHANVIDSVPAEWEVTDVSNTGVPLDAVLEFADNTGSGTLDGTIDDITELSINAAGTNVPDGTFTFTGNATSGSVDFVDANGDKSVQFVELINLVAGTFEVANGTDTITAFAFDTCVDVTKGNSGKAATGIECNNATNVETKVTIETRKSPGKGHKDLDRQKVPVFKPTFCTNGETFPVNDGAQAILVNGTGHVVFSTFMGMIPIVLDFTLPLNATSVDTGDGLFDCTGELKPAT